MSRSIRIRSRIKINGVNPYVPVTAAEARRLKPGWRRPLPVSIKVNGRTNPPWRINLMPMGHGHFYLYLRGNLRKASGTAVGDVIDVQIRFDDQYSAGPAPAMADWFERALRNNAAASAGWRQLTPSRQKEIARYLSALKSEAARLRNLLKVLNMLAGGRAGRR
jgi:hypothetical protein